MLTDAAVIAAGYLLGSIPFPYIIARLFTGKDIRRQGDGNVGMRNVLHTAGPIPGLLTLLLDGGKGAAAYWVSRQWGSAPGILYLAGFAMMVGHGFPVWLGWHGGKGLTPASGFLLPMWPHAVLAALVILLIARALLPNFDLAFAVTAAVFLGITLWQGNDLVGALFVCLLLGLAGLKRLIDLPHERMLLASTAHAGGTEQASRALDRNHRHGR